MKYTAIFGTIAIVLTFAGYIPYIRDIFLGKTKPHIYTWLIWGVLPIMIFILQARNGGGIGSYVTLSAGIVCLLIAFLALFYGTNNITKIDTFFLIMTLIGYLIWLKIDNQFFSNLMLCGIDILAFIPTCRKSYFSPFDETLSSYIINFVRFLLAIIALNEMNRITLLYPLIWSLANGFFAIFLYIRRKQLNHI